MSAVPQIGRPVLFSGAKVRAWIAGEPVLETVTTGRRFFGSARKRRA